MFRCALRVCPESTSRWTGERSAGSLSPSGQPAHATSWPAGSSTAAGSGCASRPDVRREPLLRGRVPFFRALGWVPWALVFDNMKTVTTGRDGAGQPVWHPASLGLAADFDFHPQAWAVGGPHQKGSVESLV